MLSLSDACQTRSMMCISVSMTVAEPNQWPCNALTAGLGTHCHGLDFAGCKTCILILKSPCMVILTCIWLGNLNNDERDHEMAP